MKYFLLIILMFFILTYIFISSSSSEFSFIKIENLQKCDLRFLNIPRSKMNKCLTYPNPPQILLSNTQFSNIKSLLSWTIIYDCENIFYYLIDSGVDVNSICYENSNMNGYTSLYYAVLLNRTGYIIPLLNSSANLEYLGGHFDGENKMFISTKTYFDVAYNEKKYEAFCELYKYLLISKLEKIKLSVIEIFKNDIDFYLSFLNKCK